MYFVGLLNLVYKINGGLRIVLRCCKKNMRVVVWAGKIWRFYYVGRAKK